MNRNNKFVLLIGMVSIAMAMSGCGVVNSLRAKDSLNEGVREFNKGKYDLAREKFERSLELSPGMKNAQLFHARTLNAQFETTLDKERGLETLQAYETIISENPNDHKAIDQSLAFITNVYEKMSENATDDAERESYRQKQRDTLQRRADAAKTAGDIETEAAVYHALGASYWNESYYGHSERYARYNREVTPDVAEKMRPLIMKGHEYIQKSISIKPDQPDVWVFQRLLLHEELKIETDPARKKNIEEKIKEASANYDKYRDQQQKSAEQAAGSGAAK